MSTETSTATTSRRVEHARAFASVVAGNETDMGSEHARVRGGAVAGADNGGLSGACGVVGSDPTGLTVPQQQEGEAPR